jgi:hypothetical protein
VQLAQRGTQGDKSIIPLMAQAKDVVDVDSLQAASVFGGEPFASGVYQDPAELPWRSCLVRPAAIRRGSR